jgi:predicted O-methyltransferase YrrM
MMNKEITSQLIDLYKKSDQYLLDLPLGKGLWALDAALGEYIHRKVIEFGCKKGVEIGAGVGYSTVWLGLAVKENGGSLVSFEYFAPKVEVLKAHLEQFELTDVVEVVAGDFRFGSFEEGIDVVFLDHRKCDYLESLELLLPSLAKGAYIFADNAVSHAKEMKDYLDFVRNDKRFNSQLVSIGAGLEVTQYT